MPTYVYQMREQTGGTTTGRVAAANLAEAARMLRGQSGQLLDVTLAAGQNVSFLKRLHDAVNIQSGPGLTDILSFTSQLSVMIKAGISVRGAIDGIAEQVENPRFKKIIEQIRQDVEGGKAFSEALARHPKIFNPLYVNLVRASEMSGNFGHMLDRIAGYLRQQSDTRSMVRGAMAYPVIIAVMAVVTTTFLLTFVLPKFKALFNGKEALLPAPTKFLMGLSQFLIGQWYVVVGGLICLGVGFTLFIRTPVGRLWWDRAILRIPLLKRMFRALYITRGLQTMGEMINAGVPMLETLAITADVSGNSLYRNMWMVVYRSVKGGKKIAAPLQRSTLLPRNVVHMISAGEESGKLGEVLADVSEFYATELRNTIKAVTSMIEPLMIVTMGVVVGFIAMSIVLPIFKMSSLVKH